MPNEDLRDVFAISIHALLTEGDALMRRQKNLRGDISIHALLTEGDTIARGTYGKGTISIHALLTEGDGPAPRRYAGDTDFNPRPPHGGRQPIYRSPATIWRISIHALLTEGDQSWCMQAHNQTLFQSTPSSRRATPPPVISFPPLPDFNPRPPHGGRRVGRAVGAVVVDISIHALLTEGD